jgi:kinesin family member C2/C3
MISLHLEHIFYGCLTFSFPLYYLLSGNIRVYCRVRPFLPGQDGKTTVIDYIGENGDILITNPFKQGKDACRMFKFNKVFNTHASQGIS